MDTRFENRKAVASQLKRFYYFNVTSLNPHIDAFIVVTWLRGVKDITYADVTYEDITYADIT